MSFSVEAIETAPNSVKPIEMAESKVFTGFDPKGTTTVTGSTREVPNVKQEIISEEQAAPAAQEESVTLSPKISAIARKEQAQRKREFEFRQREKALEAKLADADKFAQLKSKIAAKDYSAAEELGLTYEEYTKHLLDKQAGENPEEQRYLKVEKQLEELKKAQEEQINKEYLANQALWKQEIARVVGENEEFSTIKELKMEDAVLRHINDSFDEDGTELSAEEAAKEIEAELFARAEKFTSISKIKSKFPEQSKVLGPPKTGIKTITQNMTVTSETKRPSKPFHMMSEMEQWEEARRRVEAAKLQR